jgi:hypothetical protein
MRAVNIHKFKRNEALASRTKRRPCKRADAELVKCMYDATKYCQCLRDSGSNVE